MLGLPLTFALSQDQTLQLNLAESPKESLTVERVLNSFEFVARLRSRPAKRRASCEASTFHGTRDTRSLPIQFSETDPTEQQGCSMGLAVAVKSALLGELQRFVDSGLGT